MLFGVLAIERVFCEDCKSKASKYFQFWLCNKLMMHITFSVDFLTDRVSTNMLFTQHFVAISAPKADLKTIRKTIKAMIEEKKKKRDREKTKRKKNQTNNNKK